MLYLPSVFNTLLIIDFSLMYVCHLLFQLSIVLLPGNHVVMVTVANGLTSISATLNVSVLYPIDIRHITARPVTLGRPFVIEAVVSGDLDFAVVADFGDGTYINSSHPDIDITPLTDFSGNGSVPPVYLLKVGHLYMSRGVYLVSLSVANELSHVTKSLTAGVSGEDFNVTLTADCRSPVPSNVHISLTALLSADDVDDDVEFKWICERCTEAPLVHRFVVLFLAFL